MTTARAGVAVVAVAALLAAGCSSKGSDSAADAATQAGSSLPSTAVDGAPGNEGTTASTSPGGASGAPGAPSTPTPSNGGTTKPGDKGSTATPTTTTTAPSQSVSGSSNFPLDVSITPMCVTPGKPLSIVVTTRPYASIAAALAFSDDDAHGAYTVDSTPPDGVWRWNLVVSPDAPAGPARFIVSAQDRAPWSNEHGGGTNGEGKKGTFPFEVRSKC